MRQLFEDFYSMIFPKNPNQEKDEDDPLWVKLVAISMIGLIVLILAIC